MDEEGDNETNYYDSLFYGKIKGHVKMQACNIYKFLEEELSVNVRACQQQSNRIDCGAYTVGSVRIYRIMCLKQNLLLVSLL